MPLNLVWAQSTSGVIGRAQGIPWHVPEDMARFKELTAGRTVVMGRATWESLPTRFRPLPGRRNVVLTRQSGYVADGATVVADVDRALDDDAWVIGGAQIYAQTISRATRCEVTEIDADLETRRGDALAPVLDDSWVGDYDPWQVSRTGLRYRFATFLRP